MGATEIRRATFTVADEKAAAARETLAKDASEFLGYKKLAQQCATSSVLSTLRKLEIEPMVERDVEKYQRKKAKNGMWTGHRDGLICLAICVACGLIAFGLGSMLSWTKGLSYALSFTGVILFGIAAVVCAFTAVMSLGNESFRGTRITREWKRCCPCDFTGAIPDFVLAKAVAIRKENKDTNLLVEYLVENQEKAQVRDPDPFLMVAETGSNKFYYIDAWDEREFEAKL